MYLIITDNYKALLEDLLSRTNASRVTLRLQHPGKDYPVAAEALAEGVDSIAQVESVPQRNTPTVDHIRREMRTLVVGDLMLTTPRPPEAMVSLYGLRSFMMAPLGMDSAGELHGWVSVHANSPMQWSEADRAAIEDVADRVQRSLDLQKTIDDLRSDLGNSRCTLRQDVPGDYDYPVTHEALADGVKPIKNYRNLPQLGSPTFERIGRTRKMVIQNDCLAAATGGDSEYSTDYQLRLNADYGNMSAFIAAPVYLDEKLGGVISVHECDRTRNWTEADAARVDQAVERVKTLLTCNA